MIQLIDIRTADYVVITIADGLKIYVHKILDNTANGTFFKGPAIAVIENDANDYDPIF